MATLQLAVQSAMDLTADSLPSTRGAVTQSTPGFRFASHLSDVLHCVPKKLDSCNLEYLVQLPRPCLLRMEGMIQLCVCV